MRFVMRRQIPKLVIMTSRYLVEEVYEEKNKKRLSRVEKAGDDNGSTLRLGSAKPFPRTRITNLTATQTRFGDFSSGSPIGCQFEVDLELCLTSTRSGCLG